MYVLQPPVIPLHSPVPVEIDGELLWARVHHGMVLGHQVVIQHGRCILACVLPLVVVLHFLARVRARAHSERAEAEVARRVLASVEAAIEALHLLRL